MVLDIRIWSEPLHNLSGFCFSSSKVKAYHTCFVFLIILAYHSSLASQKNIFPMVLELRIWSEPLYNLFGSCSYLQGKCLLYLL